MARQSDVTASDLERDASPDPITLPSSPLGPRSAQSRRTRNSTKPTPRKTPRRSATPSKSMVIDTPNGDASPWRIKVTVEAEPTEGSPGKRWTRTTSVPLQGSASKGKRSSSPVKRAMAKKADAGEIKRPARKRKATPIREKGAALPPPPPSPPEMQLQSEHKNLQDYQSEVDHDMDLDLTPEEDDAVPTPSLSAVRRISGKHPRLSSVHDFAASKRLSVAREELDLALQKAVGHSSPRFTASPRFQPSPRFSVPGDKTVSLNEDFSIISVDSLKSAKEASFSRSKNGEDTSAATVSYMASSPPKPQYPDVSTKATKARSSLANEYDPMSWRPTGSAKHLSPPQDQSRRDSHRQSHEQQWERERQSVSRRIDKANPDDVVVVEEGGEVDDENDDTDFDEGDEQLGREQEDEDLWQGEASRSLEEEEQAANSSHRSSQHQQQLENSTQREERLEDLFAGQPLKPARSKIPRTWRRSSGMDFSYVDSPAHGLAQGEGDAEDFEGRRHSTDGSGVLTPPSTDEDEQMDAKDVQEEEPESEFQPDAEATRYNLEDADVEGDFGSPSDGAHTPDSEVDSAEAEDTGNFFWNNLPQVFKSSTKKVSGQRRRRPERQKTMDLTELLGLGGNESPAKAAPNHSQAGNSGDSAVHQTTSQAKYSPIPMRPLDANIKMSPANRDSAKTLDSPLRKSLLKSSKVQDDSSVGNVGASQQDSSQQETGVNTTNPPKRRWGRRRGNEQADESAQLLRKPPRRSYAPEAQESTQEATAGHDEEMRDQEPQEEEQAEAEHDHEGYEEYDNEEEEEPHEQMEPSQSYEERLNLDSPQKIKVKFGDSSSLLHPQRDHSSVFDLKSSLSMANAKKRYPPLFGSRAAFDQDTLAEEESQSSTFDPLGEVTLVAKQPAQQQRPPNQPGFISRLSSTFWSAVIRPTGPSEIMPEQQQQDVAEVLPMNLLREIRHRYGVVSEDFPWDTCHMRTLHRMINSLVSHRSDSIVPTSGPLPPQVAKYINTWQKSISGYKFVFAREYAYVVYTFMQIMVPEDTIAAMEKGDIEFLGDDIAAKCREYYNKDIRHGSDPVWQVKLGNSEAVCEFVDEQKGKIGLEFAVRAVGDVILANKQLEKREGMSIAEMFRVGKL